MSRSKDASTQAIFYNLLMRGLSLLSAEMGKPSVEAPEPGSYLDADQRILAIRWILQRRCLDAAPMLEGIYLIEDNSEVRGEIARALRELRFTGATGQETRHA